MNGLDGAGASKPLLDPYDPSRPNEEDLNYGAPGRQSSKSSNHVEADRIIQDNLNYQRSRQSSRSNNPFEQPGSRFSDSTVDTTSGSSTHSKNPFEQHISSRGSINNNNDPESRRRSPGSMDARGILAATSAYPLPSSSHGGRSGHRSVSNPRSSKQPRSTVTDCGPDGPAPGQKSYPPIVGENKSGGRHARQRASSLGQRFPGDNSHRPLDIIRKEVKVAERAPHLKRHHIPGADLIDSLDDSMGSLYHHEGPYDATLRSRNNMSKKEYNPVEALKESNEEALRATPRENIQDSLRKHVPLQGVAVIPPGRRQHSGEIMMYREGDDMMRDGDAPGGPYKRWNGVRYLPEDLKGKGEPAFSMEEAMKRGKSRSTEAVTEYGYEMQPRSRRHTQNSRSAADTDANGYLTTNRPQVTRASSGNGREYMATGKTSATADVNGMSYREFEKDMRRSNTTGGKLGGLKRRIGSLRRSKKSDGSEGVVA